MTAPVDVLAVMDREIRSVAYDVKNEQAEPDYLAKLCEARAAVAELIPAARSNVVAVEQMVNILEHFRDAPDFNARLEAWLRAYAFSAERGLAALARVTGETA